MNASRLRDEAPQRWDIPVLALLALALLVYAVFRPALRFANLLADDVFSVWSGIVGFFEHGNLLLAGLIFAFSVLFPAGKLVVVQILYFGRLTDDQRQRWVTWLELLGKWSLLDAFVIAILVGTVQLGLLTEARAEFGIYLYLAAILLSLLVTFLLHPLLVRGEGRPSSRLQLRWLVLTVPSALLYGIGMSLPLLEIEAGWFWESEFSVLKGTRRMFEEGEVALAISLLLFVILLPLLRFAGLIVLRGFPITSARATRALRFLDRWSMLDVFMLALFVVFTKLGALATATPRAGMWCLFAAALLSGADSILLQRRKE